jgi:predicted enzyme related to lactoylglutathione lyase
MPIARFLAIVIDCHDPAELAGFWKEMLGGSIEPRTQSPEWVALNDVPGLGILAFQRVPEAKTIKNRLHIDVDVTDIASSVEAAVALGAVTVGDVVEEPTNRFQVMRDPEGNEFCFVTSASVTP